MESSFSSFQPKPPVEGSKQIEQPRTLKPAPKQSTNFEVVTKTAEEVAMPIFLQETIDKEFGEFTSDIRPVKRDQIVVAAPRGEKVSKLWKEYEERDRTVKEVQSKVGQLKNLREKAKKAPLSPEETKRQIEKNVDDRIKTTGKPTGQDLRGEFKEKLGKLKQTGQQLSHVVRELKPASPEEFEQLMKELGPEEGQPGEIPSFEEFLATQEKAKPQMEIEEQPPYESLFPAQTLPKESKMEDDVAQPGISQTSTTKEVAVELQVEPSSHQPLPKWTRKDLDPDSTSLGYVQQLMKYEEKNNLSPDQMYQFLLRPGNIEKQFRKHFVSVGAAGIAPPDENGGNPALVIQMIQLFNQVPTAEEGSKKRKAQQKAIDKQQRIIIRFARRLIENGTYSKESMQPIIDLVQKALVEKKLQGSNLETAEDLLKAELKKSNAPSVLAKQYKFTNNVNLSKEFENIAKGKMGKQEKNDFIRFFVQSYNTISKNTLKNLRDSEFYREAWNKKNAEITSPNLTFMIKSFNKLSNFVVDQILSAQTPDEAFKVYSTFVTILDQFEQAGNYGDGQAILAGLNDSSITRIGFSKFLPDEKGARLTEIETIHDPSSSFKKLRAAMSSHDGGEKKEIDLTGEPTKPTAYTPYIGMYLTDLTFTNENPDYTSNGPNFDKMAILEKIHGEIKKPQDRIEERTDLPYDVIKQITDRPATTAKDHFSTSLQKYPRNKELSKGILGKIKLVQKEASS